MSDEITPALSAEEWARYNDPALADDITRLGVVESLYTSHDDAALMAWLNHNLPGTDPRKITRADMEACRAGRIASAGEEQIARKDGRIADAHSWAKQARALDALLRKLAALLPP